MSDERAFLTAILEHPDDDGCKLVYADFLEEHGDPRGEYLRLMMQVRQERVVTREQQQRDKELSDELARLQNEEYEEFIASVAHRGPSHNSRRRRNRIRQLETLLADLSKQLRQHIPARLQELAATLDPTWLAVVSDPEIEGCGRSSGRGRLRFDFVCDRSWADMKPTEDQNIRHCEECKRNVHFCDNIADARDHSQSNHCIAVDLGVIRRDGDLEPRLMVAGMPSREYIRQTYEEDVDAVSKARLDARTAKQKQTR